MKKILLACLLGSLASTQLAAAENADERSRRADPRAVDQKKSPGEKPATPFRPAPDRPDAAVRKPVPTQEPPARGATNSTPPRGQEIAVSQPKKSDGKEEAPCKKPRELCGDKKPKDSDLIRK